MDAMFLANIKKDNPEMLPLIKVFTKKGISVMEAIGMLGEIAMIAQTIQENKDDEE